VTIPDHYLASADFYTSKAIAARIQTYASFKAQKGQKIVLHLNKSTIRGLDPMNAIAISDSLVIHSTLLELHGKQEYKMQFNNIQVVTQVLGSLWNVKKLVFFINDGDLKTKDNKILLQNEHVNIQWSYSEKKENKEYVEYWLH
jgi:hypothetical protein